VFLSFLYKSSHFMTKVEAARFLREAEECFQQAVTVNPLDQQSWLRMAKEWIELVKGAEAKASALLTFPPRGPHIGVPKMKVSTFATFLTFSSALISTANAHDQRISHVPKDYQRTGTVIDIALQYSNGGRFGGVTSGTTGTVLDVAHDSIDWQVLPIVAKGD
jgi:hypothetical protein